MAEELKKSDYLELIDNLKIQVKEHRLNIKDARNARRHSKSKDDRRAYIKVIRWNRENMREAKAKIRIIKTRYQKSWWLWLVLIIGCLFIFLLVPGAGIALILSPIWIFVVLGFFFIMRTIRK